MAQITETRFLATHELNQVMPLIDRLKKESSPWPTDSELVSIGNSISQHGGGVVGCFVGSELIATCTLNVCPNLSWSGSPYAIIENVVVHPDYRQQGLGKLVLQFAAEKAKVAGCYKVALMTGSKKESTLKFYLSAGFEQSKTGFQIRFDA